MIRGWDTEKNISKIWRPFAILNFRNLLFWSCDLCLCVFLLHPFNLGFNRTICSWYGRKTIWRGVRPPSWICCDVILFAFGNFYVLVKWRMVKFQIIPFNLQTLTFVTVFCELLWCVGNSIYNRVLDWQRNESELHTVLWRQCNRCAVQLSNIEWFHWVNVSTAIKCSLGHCARLQHVRRSHSQCELHHWPANC